MIHKYLVDNHDVGFVYVDEENFGSNRKYAYQVAELFNKYNILWWACGTRCTSINEADVIHYKRNGCNKHKLHIVQTSISVILILIAETIITLVLLPEVIVG